MTDRPRRPADETLWDALLLSEHAWAVVDEERLRTLGRDEGMAILDELGFAFTSLREAVAALRPKLRRLSDSEFGLDPKALVSRAKKARDPTENEELLGEAVAHEVALEENRLVARRMRTLAQARKKWDRLPDTARDRWEHLLEDFTADPPASFLGRLRKATGMSATEAEAFLAWRSRGPA